MKQAPEGTSALLAKFDAGPLGALPRSRGCGTTASAAIGPIDFLLEHGILVPLDNEHVELPREAGLALRAGKVFAALEVTPPPISARSISVARRDNAALGAVAELLREVNLLAQAIQTEGIPTLRSGGVGVRALKPLSSLLDVPPERVIPFGNHGCSRPDRAGCRHLTLVDLGAVECGEALGSQSPARAMAAAR
ncbi:hypothetical protein [Renibacterium salmoninarum]|uniref:hypothetical protein n=1 Tax=Renibacterium salmoninarum TaxID=1646 RepID=UPI00031A02EC|nr:hypothetical protein [Renibacterium salmoninarum]